LFSIYYFLFCIFYFLFFAFLHFMFSIAIDTLPVLLFDIRYASAHFFPITVPSKKK